MAEIILITGGSRSGKSAFAQQLAEQREGARLFLATCPATDDEMRERIKRHIADRKHGGWDTEEELTGIAARLGAGEKYRVVLVDCLTLWVNNIMYEAHRNGRPVTEDAIAQRAAECVEAARRRPGTVIFVTNEVGLGIVPDNEAARLFRDLAGRCNQQVAAAADSVYLVTCSIPIKIKGT